MLCISDIIIWTNKPSCQYCKKFSIGKTSFFCERKKKFGFNLQAMCNHKLRFCWIELHFYGIRIWLCLFYLFWIFRQSYLRQPTSSWSCVVWWQCIHKQLVYAVSFSRSCQQSWRRIQLLSLTATCDSWTSTWPFLPSLGYSTKTSDDPPSHVGPLVFVC